MPATKAPRSVGSFSAAGTIDGEFQSARSSPLSDRTSSMESMYSAHSTEGEEPAVAGQSTSAAAPPAASAELSLARANGDSPPAAARQRRPPFEANMNEQLRGAGAVPLLDLSAEDPNNSKRFLNHSDDSDGDDDNNSHDKLWDDGTSLATGPVEVEDISDRGLLMPGTTELWPKAAVGSAPDANGASSPSPPALQTSTRNATGDGANGSLEPLVSSAPSGPAVGAVARRAPGPGPVAVALTSETSAFSSEPPLAVPQLRNRNTGRGPARARVSETSFGAGSSVGVSDVFGMAVSADAVQHVRVGQVLHHPRRRPTMLMPADMELQRRSALDVIQQPQHPSALAGPCAWSPGKGWQMQRIRNRW